MPHGGGHHGGGFHGGGFHGGGGFHHHHHHHHSNYGGVVYTGGFLPYRQRRLRAPVIFIGVIVAVVICAVIGLGFGIHGTYGGVDDYYFSPGDSRLYGYSPFFCLGGQVNYEDHQSIVSPDPDTASLYLLSSKPSLTHTNSFFVNKTHLISSDSYRYWYYYLYPGSKITVSGCTSNSRSFYLILVKGKGTFKSWINHPYSWHTVATKLVQTRCPNLNDPSSTLVYDITDEDTYYVIMDNTLIWSVDATMSLHVSRTGYSVKGFTNQPNCTGSTGCLVYANNKNDQIKYALVLTSDASDSNWDKNVEVDYYCISNVVGYVVVTAVPLFAVAGLCITAAVIIVCVVKIKKKRSTYQPVSIATSPPENDYPKMPPQSNPPPAYNPTASTHLTGEAPPPPYAP